jgi:methylated-DNA-[protein]-cysteine S-methyltransferase
LLAEISECILGWDTKEESKMDLTPVYYDLLSTKELGLMGIGVSEKGLCFVSMGHSSDSEIRAALKAQFPQSRLTNNPYLVAPARKQLEEYLHGRRKEFDLALDLNTCTSFQREVLLAAQNIPYGETRSYEQLAQMIGKPKASRAVGGALGGNPVPIVIPCHRVLAKDGSLCGFRGGVELKRQLLKLEGAQWKE